MTGPYTRISPDSVLRSPDGLTPREFVERALLAEMRSGHKILCANVTCAAPGSDDAQFLLEAAEETKKLHNRILRKSGLDGTPL